MSKKLASVLVRTVIGLVALLVTVFIAGAVAGYLSARGTVDADAATIWILVAVAVTVMIGGMVVSVAWMRSIDEAAREAHKAAWFWGGCTGMSIGGVLIILASIPRAATLSFPSWFADDRTDPAAYAATGAFGMMLLMMIGYLVVWAWWWITRMRE